MMDNELIDNQQSFFVYTLFWNLSERRLTNAGNASFSNALSITVFKFFYAINIDQNHHASTYR